MPSIRLSPERRNIRPPEQASGSQARPIADKSTSRPSQADSGEDAIPSIRGARDLSPQASAATGASPSGKAALRSGASAAFSDPSSVAEPIERAEDVIDPNLLAQALGGVYASLAASPQMEAAAAPALQMPTGPLPLQTAGASLSPADIQNIQSISFILGGTDTIIEASPALALLTGRLDQLAPAAIPSLVSENPLLQTILSSPDVQSWMNTPTSLNQILESLGLQDSQLAQLLSEQGLGQASTTLQNLLKALGIDSGRVAQEGQLLQKTVPLDGLQPYMLRAAKLRAQKPQAELLAGAATLHPASILSTPDPQAQAEQVPQALEIKVDGRKKQAETATLPDVPFIGSSLPATDHVATKAVPPKELPPLQMPLFPQPMTAVPAHSPGALLSAVDPFMAISQQWDDKDIQMTDFASEAQIDRSAPRVTELVIETQGPMTLALALDPSQPEQTPQAISSSSRPLDLAEVMNALARADGSSQHKEDGAPGEGERRFAAPDDSGPQMIGNFQQKNLQQTPTTFQLTPSTPAQALPRETLQNVFDNATMMLKEGGGSIRVDLGSEGLGTLDLALDIKDKTVDLRIVASSSHVRELLNQELPRLRDSLMSQSLNLEKVEIGLSSGSTGSQLAGDGRNARNQNYENIQQSSYRGPGGRSSEVRSYRQVTTQGPSRAWHPGSIQVRV